MRGNKAFIRFIVPLSICVAAMACDAGTALFTDEELDSMFDITLSSDGEALSDGALLSSSEPIVVAVSRMPGSPEAASVSVSLYDADGAEAASVAFSSSAGSSIDVVRVDDLFGDLDPLSIPSDLPEGYYELRAMVLDARGQALSTYSTYVLVYSGTLGPVGLEVYPGGVEPGKASLLRLTGSIPPGRDPWIRWKVDGKLLAVGYLSERADRLAWRAPTVSGVYEARVELFPFRPIAGSEPPPFAKAEIRLALSSSGAEPDPLADRVAWSLFSFDGDLSDSGSRPRAAEPAAIGSPYLETHPLGYGYLLGGGAGVSSASTLLPIDEADGTLAAFSAAFTLGKSDDGLGVGSGVLLSAALGSGDGLVIGVDAGYPYLEVGQARVRADSTLGPSLSRLAVEVSPAEGGAGVRFYIDDKPAGDGLLAAEPFSSVPGACTVAGPGGFSAVYDELRVLRGAYPAFRLSETAARGGSLIAATGFEGAELDAGFSVEGAATPGEGKLVLAVGSSLAVAGSPPPSKGSALRVDLASGAFVASLALEGGGELSVSSGGAVTLRGSDAGLSVATLSAESPFRAGLGAARYQVSVARTADGLEVFGSDGVSASLDARPAEGAGWLLRPASDEPATLAAVSVSAFDPAMVSAAGRRDEAEAAPKDGLSLVIDASPLLASL
ncbi:MAG: hypothetical protein H7A27_05330 [Spirochaetaceae bacterium]|nr:hypothetical protein [Spirochaetaceae bacterium]